MTEKLMLALKMGLASLCMIFLFSSSPLAEELEWRHGVTVMGEPGYPANFQHFKYVNPDAPKGGDLRLSTTGTFNTFNPALAKGDVAEGLGLVFDTLMKDSQDEVSTSYGLIAESLAYPDDISFAKFRLREEAKWADGKPITPDDVIFSFNKQKELTPRYQFYYAHVTKAEATGPNEVTFYFDEKNNQELPQIVGQILVLPKHWWEAKDADGKPRDISRTTLEPVMGSGPYKITSFDAGVNIRYELRDDYWGKDLPVNKGSNNFGSITYQYFGDRDVEFQSFRAGNIDFWRENKAARWATQYDFPAVKKGDIKREELPNTFRAVGVMQALVPNMRRDIFKDERIRKALNYTFDFETLNKTTFFGAYKRVDSFFFGTELASRDLPEGKELDALNEVKNEVPPEIFTAPYTNPVGGSQQALRKNLRTAVGLFKEAGYEIRGTKMVNVKTGKPLTFEILLNGPLLTVVINPWVEESLKKIGIDATIRVVDAAQYTNRIRSFDYDMMVKVWAQSLNPGNEQAEYWGSNAANREGSQNYAGISDPAVDALIKMVIFAKNREDLVGAARALDRVLMAHQYVIPLYYGNTDRIAYRKDLLHPEDLPYYSVGFPDVWWMKQ